MTPSDSKPTMQLPKKSELKFDANESPFNSPMNRYPDATAATLRESWGRHERIPASCIYFCNGTEEAVDHVMRIYAPERTDSVVSVTPTRSVYKRRAEINRLVFREVELRPDNFELDAEALLDSVDNSTRLIFLCSPNNPTGNLLDSESIETILDLFEGMVVVDESYIDFIPQATLLKLLNKYKNLILLRSFSHAWSSAGARLASVVAHPEVIKKLERVGFTHPISSLVIAYAEELMERRLDIDKWSRQVIDERTKVVAALKDVPGCLEIYPSVTNFLLVRFDEVDSVYQYLKSQGIAVRPIHGALRITIGLPGENSALVGALRRRVMPGNESKQDGLFEV